MAKNKIYSQFSSHVCDDGGYELESSLLMSDGEFQRRKLEIEKRLAEYRKTQGGIYNPQTMKMEVVR